MVARRAWRRDNTWRAWRRDDTWRAWRRDGTSRHRRLRWWRGGGSTHHEAQDLPTLGDQLFQRADGFEKAIATRAEHRLAIDEENPPLHGEPLHFGGGRGSEAAAGDFGGGDLVRREMQGWDSSRCKVTGPGYCPRNLSTARLLGHFDTGFCDQLVKPTVLDG